MSPSRIHADASDPHDSALPLRWRLPNPPALFVGREREMHELAASIERGPVTVVFGLGGLGKTSLVLRTLHHRFAGRVARTVLVRPLPQDPPEQSRIELQRCLAEVAGRRVTAYEIGELPETLLARIIDLAERLDLWVLLDDLHHLGREEAEQLLMALTRYARRSRWIVATRVEPRLPELLGQVLTLAAMPEGDLQRVGILCAPGLAPEIYRNAVELAHGSPLRLRHLLQRGGGRGELETDDILADLSAQQRKLLEVLLVIEMPLLQRDLIDLVGEGDDTDVDTLQDRGLVEPTAGGVRLHDVARGLLEPRRVAVTEALALALGKRLLQMSSGTATLEGLRLVLHAGRLDLAAETLAQHGSTLLGAAYAPRLWRLLSPHDQDPGALLASWRLRTAVALGTAEVLGQVDLPPASTFEDRLVWVRLLLASGQCAKALEYSLALQRQAKEKGAESAAFEAGLMALETLSLEPSDRFEEVLATMSVLELDDAQKARRDATVVRCLAVAGRYDEAVRLLEGTEPQLIQLPPLLRWGARQQILGAALILGHVHRARKLLQLMGEDEERGPSDLFRPRWMLVWEAMLAVLAGPAERARALIEQLAPIAGRQQRLVLSVADLHRRLLVGEIEGLRSAIERLIAEASLTGNLQFQELGRELELNLALVQLTPLPDPPAGRMGDYSAIYRRRCELRRGLASRDLEGRTFPESVGQRVACELADAEAALAAGRLSEARWHASLALTGALTLGHKVHEVEARTLACEVLGASAGSADLAVAAGELRDLARELTSSRLTAEADFYTALAAAGPPRLELLATLAAGEQRAPVAARRARALLGDEVELDLIDRRVVDSARERAAPWRVIRLATSTASRWQLGWGLDGSSHRVWLADGRAVELDGAPLAWGLLESLARRGGRASKDDLVMDLWGESYDPRRHNNRLHPLVSKLRRALEDDASHPRRLVASEVGYAFGNSEPVRWLRCIVSRDAG